MKKAQANTDTNTAAVCEKPECKIAVQNLNLWYGTFHALKNVNLGVKEHEICAFIGPSGCGKSTLLKCLNRMNDLVEGCRIEGTVVNSILFPGVTVEKGAKVEDCILFRGTAVREEARLSHVITDKHVELLPGRTMVGHTAYPIVIAKGSVI